MCQQGPANVNAGLCRGRTAGLVRPQLWDTRLVFLCCPSILQAGIALLLLLLSPRGQATLRAIAQGLGKPLTVQICTALLVQAGAGAEGVVRLIREHRICSLCGRAVRKLWLAQESKAWGWMCYYINMPKKQSPGKVARWMLAKVIGINWQWINLDWR